MAVFTTSCTFIELQPNSGVKEIIVTTPDAATSDVIEVTLADHGITTVSGVLSVTGYICTASSTILIEAPTTSIANGVLTITSGDALGKKSFRILGVCN